MEIIKLNCDNMSKQKIEALIQSYSDLGWDFAGIDDFPPPHVWVKMIWGKETQPIFPQESNK